MRSLCQKAQVIYAPTHGEVEDLCRALLASGVKQTGWDLEWRVDFTRGASPSRAALMQICFLDGSAYKCLLLHIFYSSIPESLRNYLTDQACTDASTPPDQCITLRSWSASPISVMDLICMGKCRQ